MRNCRTHCWYLKCWWPEIAFRHAEILLQSYEVLVWYLLRLQYPPNALWETEILMKTSVLLVVYGVYSAHPPACSQEAVIRRRDFDCQNVITELKTYPLWVEGHLDWNWKLCLDCKLSSSVTWWLQCWNFVPAFCEFTHAAGADQQGKKPHCRRSVPCISQLHKDRDSYLQFQAPEYVALCQVTKMNVKIWLFVITASQNITNFKSLTEPSKSHCYFLAEHLGPTILVPGLNLTSKAEQGE